MKQISALVLMICLLLSLAACSPKAEPARTEAPQEESTAAPETKAPETEAPETEAPETEAPETKAPETEAPETEAPETEAPETKTPETEAPADAPRVHGTVDGDVYTNEVLDLRVTRPDGWIFYTEEQIAAQNSIAADLLTEGSQIAEQLRENGQMIDMVLQKADGSNMNLVIQPGNVFLSLYSDEQLFELLKETYQTQLTEAGMEVKSYETMPMQIFGEERTILHMDVEMFSIPFSEYVLWVRDNPEYCGILTLTLAGGEDPQEYFDLLSRIN